MQAKLLQLCPTLWHLMDYSSAGSSVHLLEWVAMLCSRGFSWPRDQRHRDMGLLCLLHWQAGSLPIAPPGKPINRASQVAQIVKNLPAIQETWIWSLGWEWLPTPVFLPEEFHGQRSRLQSVGSQLNNSHFYFYTHTHAHMNHFATPETNTTLYINSTPIKNKILKKSVRTTNLILNTSFWGEK